jgi:hypothetical protein
LAKKAVLGIPSQGPTLTFLILITNYQSSF